MLRVENQPEWEDKHDSLLAVDIKVDDVFLAFIKASQHVPMTSQVFNGSTSKPNPSVGAEHMNSPPSLFFFI